MSDTYENDFLDSCKRTFGFLIHAFGYRVGEEEDDGFSYQSVTFTNANGAVKIWRDAPRNGSLCLLDGPVRDYVVQKMLEAKLDVLPDMYSTSIRYIPISHP